MQVAELIERANSHTGNAQLTAGALGVSRARVYDWKNGVRPCPMEMQVKLCELAELDDAELASYVRAAAGIEKKPTRISTGQIGSSIVTAIGVFAIGIAAFAAPTTARATAEASAATMYIMSTRRVRAH